MRSIPAAAAIRTRFASGAATFESRNTLRIAERRRDRLGAVKVEGDALDARRRRVR
jgi:hypothetical protein